MTGFTDSERSGAGRASRETTAGAAFLSDAILDHLQLSAAGLPTFSHPRYEIIELIGEGGMGRVYRARDRELDREIALKLVREPTVHPIASELTIREARILARLEHPGIVPVHDAGQTPDGRIFYVMKLVRGQRLDERFAAPVGTKSRSGHSPEALAERLRVFERICETVAFAHSHGFLHRDLKPQNVMVGACGEVAVLDWGIARFRPPATLDEEFGLTEASTAVWRAAQGVTATTSLRRTRAGVVLGTPAYMSPEQARGEIERLDERSDVFGLGGILYFLLTGRAPLSRTLFERVRRDKAIAIESPRRVNPSVPRPLAAICEKALASAAERRYSKVAELAAEIGRFRGGERVYAYRESAVARALSLAWKHRTAIGLVGAYLLIRWLAIVLF